MKTNGKPVIIEFVGPPGTGKTTSSHCFANVLRNKGLNVCLIGDLEKYLKGVSLYKKFSFLLKSTFQKGHLLILYLKLFLSEGIFSFDSFIHYASLILRETTLKQFIKEQRFDVILLDQWAIQAIWSSTIFQIEPGTLAIGKLKKLYFDSDIILYFDIDPVIASKRMEMRSTFNSRFDQMDFTSRNFELSKYNDHLFQLYLNSECKNKFVFSTELAPFENAKTLLTILELDKDTDTLYNRISGNSNSVLSI